MPGVPVDTYLAAVEAGRDAVSAGRLTKVVIARDVIVEADRPLDVHAILLRLRASFGSSYRYSVDGFVGASPELLVARHGDVVRSHPLAGTAPRTGDPTTDAVTAAALIASTKDQVEHRVVIDVVHETLLPWCSYVDWEAEPSIVTVANVQHLGTLIEGRLSSPPPNVLELVEALSPTPRSAGTPEPRRWSSSPPSRAWSAAATAGPSAGSTAGNGTWAVAIRCAEIDGRPGPGCSPVGASWPTAIRTPSWPRRRPSCRRCCRPSCGPEPRPARSYWTVELVRSSGVVSQRSHGVMGRMPFGIGVRRAGGMSPLVSTTKTFVPSGSPVEEELGVAVLLAHASGDSDRPSCSTLWMGRPCFVGMLWKPIAAPVPPRAKRTMNSMRVGLLATPV